MMRPEVAGATRALLRAANGLGSRGVEALWASASAATGVLAVHRPMRKWSSSGRERVIAFAPHPDDESIGCAGTVMRHRQRGDSVRIVIVTDGARSIALGLDRESMASRRQMEAMRAARRMGVDCQWIGLPEGDWSEPDGLAAIRSALADVVPTLVYAPSSLDYHPEHRRVARVIAAALAELRAEPEIRIYSVQVPLTPLLTNLIHDVSDIEAHIRSVFACYASQRESLTIALRLRHYAARFHRAAHGVEAFLSCSARDYISLHARPDATFRPLMIRAWTDPLAAFVGLSERLFWRHRAAGGRRYNAVSFMGARTGDSSQESR